MQDNMWSDKDNGGSSSMIQFDMDKFNAIKKQMLWSSVGLFLLILLEIAAVIGYFVARVSSPNNLIVRLVCLGALIVGFIVIGHIQFKVKKIKKRQFKDVVVREEISKKCELQSYLHIPEECEGFPLAFQLIAWNHPEMNYSMSDYMRGKYHGYAFRMIDFEWSVGNNSGGNVHLLVIETNRCYDDGYLHLCPFARFFSNFQKIDQYDNTPFFMHPDIKKKIMACEAKKPDEYLSVTDALALTVDWEKKKNLSNHIDPSDGDATSLSSQSNDSIEPQHATSSYGSQDVLTDELATILLEASKNHKDLNIHFEKDFILVTYSERKDLFEPHFKYAFSSREEVGGYIQRELDQSFSLFDKLLPFINGLPKS